MSKYLITNLLTFSPNYETIEYQTKGEALMPLYRVQREYTNWEEIIVEAESEEIALEVMEDESHWDYAKDVNTYNYTGETWIGEADE